MIQSVNFTVSLLKLSNQGWDLESDDVMGKFIDDVINFQSDNLYVRIEKNRKYYGRPLSQILALEFRSRIPNRTEIPRNPGLKSASLIGRIMSGILDIKSEITGAVGFINIYLDPLRNG